MVSLHALYRRAEKLTRAADELAAQRGRDDLEVKRARCWRIGLRVTLYDRMNAGARRAHDTTPLSLGFLALDDLSFAVEVKHDRRHVKLRSHLLCDPALTPVLVIATGGMESKHDQISVELRERVGDRDDLILRPDLSLGRQALRVHVVEEGQQTFIGRHESVVPVVGQPVHPRRQGRGDDINLLGLIEERKNRWRDLIGVRQVLIAQDKHTSCHTEPSLQLRTLVGPRYASACPVDVLGPASIPADRRKTTSPAPTLAQLAAYAVGAPSRRSP